MLILGTLYRHSNRRVAMIIPLLDLACVGSNIEDLRCNLVESFANELEIEPKRFEWVQLSGDRVAIRIPADAVGAALGRILVRVRTGGSFYQAEAVQLAEIGTRRSLFNYESGLLEIPLSKLSRLTSALKPGWELSIGLEKLESRGTMER